jgi:hypothetical protein
MASRERKITDRYAKKMHAHIKWINSLSPLESIAVRNRDILRHAFSSAGSSETANARPIFLPMNSSCAHNRVWSNFARRVPLQGKPCAKTEKRRSNF